MAEEVINWVTETEKRTAVKAKDKLLLGNVDTEETMHVEVEQIAEAAADVVSPRPILTGDFLA